jgi:hypothetical protein
LPPYSTLYGTKHGKQPDVETFNGSKPSKTFDPLDGWIGKRESSVRSGGDQIVQTIPAFLPAVVYNLRKRNYTAAMT